MATANPLPLSWLIRLRWGAVASQLVAALFARFVMHLELPWGRLSALIALSAASNAAYHLWTQRNPRIPEMAAGGVMAFDVVTLTLLLQLSGGPFNPFSFLYLVMVALAAVLLREAWSWGLAALSASCFGLLFLFDAADAEAHAHQMQMHLQGMWLAFAIAAGFIVYFVQRVRRALAEREAELASARQRSAHNEKLVALATLSAGAAHELSTPLSTIAVVARELERSLERRGVAEAVEDARLIRTQTERCHEILVRMAAEAGTTAGEQEVELELGALLRAALALTDAPERVRVELPEALGAQTVRVPSRATAEAFAGVIRNALQASPADAEVIVRGRATGSGARIEVEDRGAGMAPEVQRRAGEPFFTTKAPGSGMGLGLFLTRSVLERVGGRLELTSTEGAGTCAVLVLPLCPETRRAAAEAS